MEVMFSINDPESPVGILYYPVKKFTKLSDSTKFLLVRELSDRTENGVEVQSIEVFPVSFIASCHFDEFEYPLIVAFYLQWGSLMAYVLSSIDGRLKNAGHDMLLLDYEEYLRVCEITGDKKMSLIEYYESLKNLEIFNSFERIDGQIQNLHKA